jgi:hypothetical protein
MAFYDMSSANNGAGAKAILDSGMKSEIDAFEKEMDAQKEAGREAENGRTNTELTADSLSRAFS